MYFNFPRNADSHQIVLRGVCWASNLDAGVHLPSITDDKEWALCFGLATFCNQCIMREHIARTCARACFDSPKMWCFFYEFSSRRLSSAWFNNEMHFIPIYCPTRQSHARCANVDLVAIVNFERRVVCVIQWTSWMRFRWKINPLVKVKFYPLECEDDIQSTAATSFPINWLLKRSAILVLIGCSESAFSIFIPIWWRCVINFSIGIVKMADAHCVHVDRSSTINLTNTTNAMNAHTHTHARTRDCENGERTANTSRKVKIICQLSSFSFEF